MLNKFFDKYIFTNTLKYSHNNFFLVNIPFLIMPVDFLIKVIEKTPSSEQKEFYELIKESIKKDFMERFKDLGVEERKEVDFLRAFLSASGWGFIQLVDYDKDAKRALIVVDNSPFAEELKGKLDFPVDTLLRGVFAGIFSNIFKDEIDCVESECFALNDKSCKFVVKPKTEFDVEKKLVREQLVLE
jgi:predicted hydrocarbon binding protein